MKKRISASPHRRKSSDCARVLKVMLPLSKVGRRLGSASVMRMTPTQNETLQDLQPQRPAGPRRRKLLQQASLGVFVPSWWCKPDSFIAARSASDFSHDIPTAPGNRRKELFRLRVKAGKIKDTTACPRIQVPAPPATTARRGTPPRRPRRLAAPRRTRPVWGSCLWKSRRRP